MKFKLSLKVAIVVLATVFKAYDAQTTIVVHFTTHNGVVNSTSVTTETQKGSTVNSSSTTTETLGGSTTDSNSTTTETLGGSTIDSNNTTTETLNGLTADSNNTTTETLNGSTVDSNTTTTETLNRPTVDSNSTTTETLNGSTVDAGIAGASSCSQECFQLKLFWKYGYYWQENWNETFWCIQPVAPFSPCADDEKICLPGISLYIEDCWVESQYDAQLWIRKENTFRPCNDQTKCWTKERDNRVRLRDCDGSLQQDFIGFNSDGSPFAISHVEKPGYSVSIMHHPKAFEVLKLYMDEKAEKSTTRLWNIVPGPLPYGCY